MEPVPSAITLQSVGELSLRDNGGSQPEDYARSRFC
jgi:hypothetical protein